ncbi:MAG: DUF6273 domain-containing protein [Oscillospiraceae bacterium]|nr:DUF6273 domain-containing protein [Oscillospiraceae bacterium]
MKKILLVMLVLSVTLLLTACLGGNDNEVIEFGGIEWRVLDRQDDKALILSENLLERQPYNSLIESTTWETSDIREWLNDEFYNRFSAEERARIIETTITTDSNPWHGTSGGNDTIDKIFLLSIDEIAQYFGGDMQPNVWWNDELFSPARIAYTSGGQAGTWWLRTPFQSPNSVALVTETGFVVPAFNINQTCTFIRPAMWIYL